MLSLNRPCCPFFFKLAVFASAHTRLEFSDLARLGILPHGHNLVACGKTLIYGSPAAGTGKERALMIMDYAVPLLRLAAEPRV